MRQQRTVGAIVKIQYDDKYHTYARILNESFMAIYDFKTEKDVQDLYLIISQPILFIIGLYKNVVTSGIWKKIGILPLENEIQKSPLFYIQDELDQSKFEIYNNGDIRLALKSDCENLKGSPPLGVGLCSICISKLILKIPDLQDLLLSPAIIIIICLNQIR